MNERFLISPLTQMTAHPSIDGNGLKEFWKNCCFRLGELSIRKSEAFSLRIGTANEPTLGEYEYAINVETSGVYAVAKDETALIHAFVTLAQTVRQDEDGALYIPCANIREKPLVERRMAHFCVFPETELFELEKFIRFCGALKYTHVVLEFWGMLQYDCLKELSWKNAFSKEQIKPVLQTAKELGVQIVPMFNHWGHASASRAKHGKHVVLDQNPSLSYHFTNAGWCWNIENPKTRELLKNVRRELIELCGEGDYFHIGCDEAYGFDFSQERMSEFCTFINEIAEELALLGKRALIWGDMLVAKRPSFHPKNSYYAYSKSTETENFFLTRIDKRIVIADWQYECTEFPVETSLIFQNAGFDVIVCPWDRTYKNASVCVDTAKNGLYGVMHTTWHTLSYGYPNLLVTAYSCWGQPLPANVHTQAADLLRKAYFADGNYERAGWSKTQISDVTD